MRRPPVYSDASVLAWARDEGPDVLESAALEEALGPLLRRLSLPAGLISGMTGIEARRLYPAGARPSLGATRAARALFSGSGLGPHEVDLLYSTSVGRDFLEPSTASIIHSALGLSPECAALDLGSACLGFMDGLNLAALQVDAGLCDLALVVAGENSRPVLESTLDRLLAGECDRKLFFDNFATLTLGSGGAAMLVGRDPSESMPRLRRMISRADGSSNHLCRGDFGGMTTDSAKLLVRGVELAARTFEAGREAFGWTPEIFDLIVCHQVSEANTLRFAEALGLPWERVCRSYPLYGNMGAAAVPYTFDLASEAGLLVPGTRVAMMGIGSGLSCAMLELEIPRGFRGRPVPPGPPPAAGSSRSRPGAGRGGS
ncbi:MAG: 3-oxoacyl-ACP synthase III [Deltaproteobacteria bacterium]|jgi:3-oxoacyl-[acyl-carrier-protein] synthase-3|nr:3-oxoacyl-ACP synthase III [Deltaproteobacteria bacterium]